MTLVRTFKRPRWDMPTTMSQTPYCAAIFDHRFQRRDRALAAVEAEALGADIFLGEEFLPLLAVDDLFEDRPFALGRELDGFFPALDPLLDEAALLEVVDVHIFEADRPAVARLERLDELADARLLEAHRPAEPDRMVELRIVEAVVGRGQLDRNIMMGETQGIELGGQMPAHPIGADQHHRADRFVGGAAHRFGAGARGSRDLAGGFSDLLDRRLGRIEPGIDRVELGAPASSAAPSSVPVRARSSRRGRSPSSPCWVPQPFSSSVSVGPAQMGLATREFQPLPSPRSCLRRRPCRRRRSPRHGPCGVPAGRSGRR